MPKPDYRKATEDLIKILKITPEPEDSSIDNRIIDVTEESIGTVYQFTKNDLLVIKDTSKGANDEKL